jgi:hypothetical protein
MEPEFDIYSIDKELNKIVDILLKHDVQISALSEVMVIHNNVFSVLEKKVKDLSEKVEMLIDLQKIQEM